MLLTPSMLLFCRSYQRYPFPTVSQIISEGKTIDGIMAPITISGATGMYSGIINGVFMPTTEVFGGQTVYQKQGTEDTWLEYRSTSELWGIVSTKSKGGKGNRFIAHSKAGNLQLCGTSDWVVSSIINSSTDIQSLTLCQEKQPPKGTEPLHDNFEHSVNETQIRIWCYRKVVHKAFCDMMAKFVRYQFPRRLKDHVEAAIYNSLRVDADDAKDDSCQLLALMAETEELSRLRKSLQVSVRKHEEALKVIVDFKKRKLG